MKWACQTCFVFAHKLPYDLYFRAEREYVIDEDFMKAVRKVAENKKLETKLDYKPI